MRSLLTIFTLALAAGCYSGQGSGQIAYRTYPVADFSRIAHGSIGEVTVVPGDFAVTASAEDNVLASLTVQTRGDTLTLGRDVDWIDGIRPTVPIRFTVSSPQITAVSVSGSGRVAVHGVGATVVICDVSGSGALDLVDVPAKVVQVDVGGSGTLSASGIDATAFAAELRGSARAVVAGVTEVVRLDIAGSAVYRGANLRARQAVAEVAGAGQAFVWVDETLDARVGGVGRLGYRGMPAIEQTIQREGRVRALELPLPVADSHGD